MEKQKVYVGDSNEVKPREAVYGSIFFERDTGKVYSKGHNANVNNGWEQSSLSVNEVAAAIDALGYAKSSGTTGGSLSAGIGNQYVEIEVNGTVYKVLHDGTV